jgi:hypothetical protein
MLPLAQASRLPWSVYGVPGYEAAGVLDDRSAVVIEAGSEEDIFREIQKAGAQRSLISLDSVTDLTLSGFSRAGTYQLLRFPVQRFNGVALPFDAQLRFADHNRWFKGQLESRLFTIFKTASPKKAYAWDHHLPTGKVQHPLWHINQDGMKAVFGQENHAPIAEKFMVQARTLRVLKIGGRVFLVTGVIVDATLLGQATVTSIKEGTPAPVAAQALRTAGSWAGAWAGAKAGFALGGLLGVETGPGMALTAIGGGFVGGALGFLGADCIADLIHED